MSTFAATSLAAEMLLFSMPLLYAILWYCGRRRSMLFDAAVPGVLFFVQLLTCWLILPIFVLPPLSFYFAFRCYKKTVAEFPDAPVGARLCGLVPMAVAVATVPAMLGLIDGAYRA